jgi:hypothetical protein
LHLEEIDGGSEDDGEGAGPDGKPDVLFVEESFGTFSNFFSDEFKDFHNFCSRGLFFNTESGGFFSVFTVFITAFLNIS